MPLAVVNANTRCSDSPLVQNLLGYPSCTQTGTLEGLGIVFSIVGLLLFVIGFAGTEEVNSVTQPAAVPAPVQTPAEREEEVLTRPTNKFRLRREHYLAIGLAILVATPLIVYYAMSYNSVSGTAIQIASVSRTVSTGFFGGIDSVTYSVEAHVWSYATSLDTRVNDPAFSLVVDSHPISSAQGGSGTFKPYGYVVYYLKFTTTDSAVANSVGTPTSNNVDLGMDALMSAGLYSEYVTIGDSGTFSF